jgi:cell division transport system permease protein
MTITLFVLAALLIAGAALSSTLSELTNKVDVNVYFTVNASEEDIMALKQSLETLPEVATVSFTSRDEALALFRERHKNDQLTLQALDELGENPLAASLAIRAKETSQYESIAKFLESQQSVGGSESIISKVNFYQNRSAIERLTNIIETSRTLGLAVTLILAIASTLITFNTIRLAIYSSRDEISVMKIVGAGRWYVRGPFIMAGILYGAVSGIVVLVVMYPLVIWMGPPSEAFFGTFNVFTHYTSHFPGIFLTIVGSGIALGALSSFLAVRRYLRN